MEKEINIKELKEESKKLNLQIKELEKNIFNYDKNPKVKLFCKIKKRLGLKLSYFMIKKYMKLKKRFN